MTKSSLVTREDLCAELSDLTLPLMWALRQDAVRAFESLGIRPIKALLIELIARGMQHPKDLSEVLDTVPPTISAMLAELEERGMVGRTIDPADRRRVQLELTDKGQELRGQLRTAWIDISEARLNRLSHEEITTLVTIYQKLLAST